MHTILSTKAIAVALTAVTFTAGIGNAATISFESGEGYSLGSIGTVNGSTTNAPFTGQQGWSRSTSGGTGSIIATTTSGEYTGGRALSAGGSVTTYIGGKQGVVETTGSNTISFDAMYDGALTVGFLGNDGDSLFDQAVTQDTGIQFGGSPGATMSYRLPGFGAGGTIPGITGTLTGGVWYHHNITIGEILSGNRLITLSLRDLTNGTDLDLNGASAGNSISFSVTAAEFGVAPEDAFGGFVRVSDATANATDSAIDNLSFTAIPEPSTALLGGFGLLALLRRRRA